MISDSVEQREPRGSVKSAEEVLANLGKSVLALAETLERDVALNLIDQVMIEDYLHVVQSAYSSWKRRNVLQLNRPDERSSALTV